MFFGGAFSKITGVLGKGLATLTFDEDYKVSRIRCKEPATKATTDIAVGGINVVMVCRTLQAYLRLSIESDCYRVLLMVLLVL